MNGTSAVHHRIAIRAQHAPQADVEIQVRSPILREADNLQPVRAPDGSFVRLQLSLQNLEQCRLPAPVGAHQSNANARRESQVQVLKQRSPAQRFSDALGFNETLGFSIGCREVDLGRCCTAAGGDSREFVDQPSGRVNTCA